MGLSKVVYDGEIGAGLKAKSFISEGTLLLTVGGSMAVDEWGGGDSVSVIIPKAGDETLGPIAKRLILGPFRFANHDCSPNCQASGFPWKVFIRLPSPSLPRFLEHMPTWLKQLGT